MSSWKPADVEVRRIEGGKAKVSFQGMILKDKATVSIDYTINHDGRVRVDYAYSTDKNLPMILRVGTEWILKKEFNHVRWYGRGPDPTYADRAWEPIGVYKTTAMDNWVDYSKPQENGNKVDVRWLEVTNSKGFGLKVAGAVPLSMNVLPFSKEDLQGKAYSWQLSAPDKTVLNVDLIQMGVGGDNSWGLTALPEYRLEDKTYQYSYYIEPLTP